MATFRENACNRLTNLPKRTKIVLEANKCQFPVRSLVVFIFLFFFLLFSSSVSFSFLLLLSSWRKHHPKRARKNQHKMYMRFFLFYVENLLSHFNMAAPSEMEKTNVYGVRHTTVRTK